MCNAMKMNVLRPVDGLRLILDHGSWMRAQRVMFQIRLGAGQTAKMSNINDDMAHSLLFIANCQSCS